MLIFVILLTLRWINVILGSTGVPATATATIGIAISASSSTELCPTLR